MFFIYMLMSILWMSIWKSVDGLVCLSCSGITQPRHCHTVEECNTHQLCSVESVTNQFNEILYNVGCRNSDTCASKSSTGVTSSSTCSECCNGDLCNAKGCGTPEYPKQMGPVCFNCVSLMKGRFCHHIDVCNSSEVCYSEEMDEFGDVFVTSGCRMSTNCNGNGAGIINPGNFVGKRSQTKKTIITPVCSHCCNTSLCNDGCSYTLCNDSWHNCSYLSHHSGICNDVVLSKYCPSTCGHCLATTTTTTTTPASVDGNNCTNCPPIDCLDIHSRTPGSASGVYNVTVYHNHTIRVWCDMDTDGGGWTVFQKRFDGSVDFYQNFSAYEHGFGNISGEFWLGLETLYALTVNHSNSIRVDVTAVDNNRTYEMKPSFNIGPGPYYTLHINGTYNGTVPSQQLNNYNDKNFSTKDVDQDSYFGGHCAIKYHGAFWYTSCIYFANPNGRYNPGAPEYDMSYGAKIGNKAIEMKFRRNKS